MRPNQHKSLQTPVLAVFACVLSICCAAQARNGQPGDKAGHGLMIGAGDLLSMHVFREDELDTHLRVKDDGTVPLPLIGLVQVIGLAPADAASKIAAIYREKQLLNDPQVSLQIEQSAAERVAVLGEVEHPGTVDMTAPRGLLDVLAEAGGLLKSADRHVTIHRASGEAVTVFVPNNVHADLDAAGVLVSPGDTVLVPRAGIVYVLGDVGRPGGYLMQDDSRLSLLQALALASGSSKTASEGSARLIRSVNGVTTEIPLDLKAREKGRLPDLPLRNNDVVYIPFSLGKNMALGATTIAASASSALIYASY
jgi:polysaccharide export outer membrane protein